MTFRNILSFGNKATTIKFDNGLNLITGKNGSGKSSALLDTMAFGLYGKPYRSINLENLINRKNKKNLEVSITFSINENTKYEIIRGMVPKNLVIKKNGVKVKQLSSKALNQDEIDKIIGIDYKMFKEIISLSINHNAPFLDLPAAKKREIIEQIFNINIFADMLKEVKNEIKDNKLKISIKEKEIAFGEENLNSEQKRIEDITKTKNNFDNNKKEDIANIDKKLNEYATKLTNLKTEATRLKTETETKLETETNIETLKNDKKTLTEKIAENKYIIKQSDKDIEFLENNDVCPTCKSEFKNKSEELQSLKNNKNSAQQQINEDQKKLDDINLEITKIEKKIQQDRESALKIKLIKTQYADTKKEIEETKIKKEAILAREFTIDINSIVSGYDKKKLELDLNKSELEVSTEEQNINLSVVDVLSDSGIKTYVFEQLIPILNYNINEYLKLFDLSVVIEFDKFMEASIKILNGYEENASYYGFSEGEKKRIDMAILLSFIGVTKSIADWNCNILVIDELLDSSIDKEGLDTLLDSLKSMIKSIGNLGVYIISHRMEKEYSDQFKSLIQISKDFSGFSQIKMN